MNKLLKATKYQTISTLKHITIFLAIFCAISIAIYVIFYLLLNSVPKFSFFITSTNMQNNQTASFADIIIPSTIFLSIIAYLSFMSEFKMLIQNGYSRQTIVLSTTFKNIILCLICSIITIIYSIITNDKTLYHFFNDFYNPNNPILMLALIFIIHYFSISLVIMILSSLSKFSIAMKISIIAISIFSIIFLLSYMTNNFNFNFVELINFIVGIQNNSPDILKPIFFGSLTSIIFTFLAYFSIKKIEIK